MENSGQHILDEQPEIHRRVLLARGWHSFRSPGLNKVPLLRSLLLRPQGLIHAQVLRVLHSVRCIWLRCMAW